MTVQQIFRIDALGAALSVILMVLILPTLQRWHGIPMSALYVCGAWATLSLVYSASCAAFADLNQPKWLLGIMLSNSAYCGLTLFLIRHHFHVLNTLGCAYFLAEITVILGLVGWERRVYQIAYRAST